MATIKKNTSVKAFTRWLSKNYRMEWEMACNTNPNRGKVYDQWEFLSIFDRYGENSCGCSKAVHLLNYIVVKRHQYGGYIPDVKYERCARAKSGKLTGNQLIDEVSCWQEFADTEYADLLCPVLKYFTSKSDKVSATSEKMQENVVIIAQKAVKVGTAWAMCKMAESMNRENGFRGESADDRFEKLNELSDMQNWRDAMRNPGNSGVIFDYEKGCYKAVFIDYAL